MEPPTDASAISPGLADLLKPPVSEDLTARPVEQGLAQPNGVVKPELKGQADVTLLPESGVKPENAAHPEVTTQPDIIARPEVLTRNENSGEPPATYEPQVYVAEGGNNGRKAGKNKQRRPAVEEDDWGDEGDYRKGSKRDKQQRGGKRDFKRGFDD